MPVALLGVAGYVAILLSLLRDGESARTATAFLALAGCGFSAWLTWVEIAELEAICIWCVGSAVCMTALAGLSVARLLTRRLSPEVRTPRSRREPCRPASVSRTRAGAPEEQTPSPPSAGATQPRSRASSSASASTSGGGSPRRRAEGVERGGSAAQRAGDGDRVGHPLQCDGTPRCA